MNISLDHFGLAIDTPLAIPTSRSFRPPSWPPPRDWVCIEDKNGIPISRWGDHIWDLSPWRGSKMLLNFGDGPKINSGSPQIDTQNADILRMLVTWKIWGPRGVRAVKSLDANFFGTFRRIVEYCSLQKILATNLTRYPAVVDKVSELIAPSKFDHILYELDRLYESRDFLGFTLFDKEGIRRLKAIQPDHSASQTEYIPPRIWTYQVKRLRECLDDYLQHQQQIESCYQFCRDAYFKNYGDAIGLPRNERGPSRNPFGVSPTRLTGSRSGLVYLGRFILTADKFGIKDLIEKWIGSDTLNNKGIQAFSSYLSLIRYVGMAYVINFTLMRKEEATSIRADCLEWHDDEKFGRIPLIRGETTKTDPDSDARWVASPSVEIAIRAMKSVAYLRSSESNNDNKNANPYLLDWPTAPWARRPKLTSDSSNQKLRPNFSPYCHVIRDYPQLFESTQLMITEDDMRIARSVSPQIDEDYFKIGKPWPLAWHQLRRTGAVNMFASGKISDSSIQLQLKHLTRMMPLYYGRGNSSLRFSEDARVALVNAQYEAMGQQLADVSSHRYVSPHGEAHKLQLVSGAHSENPISLISEQDAIRYEKAARKHHISFRLTVLGGCMNNDFCDRDSVDSIGECAGGSNKAPCSHVIFDRERAAANKIRLDGIKVQLNSAQPDTPRYRALEQERRGLENYFAHINRI